MKLQYLLLLSYSISLMAGGLFDDKRSSWKDKLPSAPQITDYISWWALTSTFAYGIYWGLENCGIETPGSYAPGRILVATLVGAGGVFLAKEVRNEIHADFLKLEPEGGDPELSKQNYSTWQLYLHSPHSSDPDEIEKDKAKATAFGLSLFLTGWSIIYNPAGFKLSDSFAPYHQSSRWTNTILPMALNMGIAHGAYGLASVLLGKKKLEK